MWRRGKSRMAAAGGALSAGAQAHRFLHRPLEKIRAGLLAGLTVAVLALLIPVGHGRAEGEDDATIALRMAELLRSARTVISQNQALINDPAKGDKGLTSAKVIADATVIYQKQTGHELAMLDPASREGRLLAAQMDAIRKVMDDSQSTINQQGVAFKGFIPAVFARMVNDRFAETMSKEAKVKVTAPENLVRNRKSRPDSWEAAVLKERFARGDWPKGDRYAETATADGRPAYRLLMPEYYAASCLSCHGAPTGEMDITGYPKEGGKEGDLGAAISVVIFQ